MKQQDADQIETLQRETAKLKKINAALMSRVERSIDQQFNAFSLFETAIALDHQVLNRTQQLQDALRAIERSNDYLYRAKQQAEAASSLKSSVLISVTHDLLQPLNAAQADACRHSRRWGFRIGEQRCSNRSIDRFSRLRIC